MGAPRGADAPLLRARRLIGHHAREALLYAQGLPRAFPRRGRRLLLLPSHTRIMSSLLRVHLVADELSRMGWSTLVAPPQLEAAQRARVMRFFDPHLILMQKSRHPLNDPALLEGRPFVYDLDDADFADPRLTERIDRTCREARGVIAGSRYVAEWCGARNPNTCVVWTGTPVTPGPRLEHAARAPILTWAQSDPARYLPEFRMVEAAAKAARARLPALRLRLYDWRGGEGEDIPARLEAAGIEIERRPRMPYADFLRSLQETAVGLAPICETSEFGRGKSFGKILGYLDAKTPVIASDAVDHALVLGDGAGVVSDDIEVWGAEIARLLGDPEARERIAERGFETLRDRLSIAAASERVAEFIAPLARA